MGTPDSARYGPTVPRPDALPLWGAGGWAGEGAMFEHPAAVLARHLAANAEDVCRHYLSNGSRAGRYWLVGDVQNSKGRSLYVRLDGPLAGPGAVGKWADAATGEHGDLLDLIRLR